MILNFLFLRTLIIHNQWIFNKQGSETKEFNFDLNLTLTWTRAKRTVVVVSYTLVAAVPWNGLQHSCQIARLCVLTDFKKWCCDVSFLTSICVNNYFETEKSLDKTFLYLIFASHINSFKIFKTFSHSENTNGKTW